MLTINMFNIYSVQYVGSRRNLTFIEGGLYIDFPSTEFGMGCSPKLPSCKITLKRGAGTLSTNENSRILKSHRSLFHDFRVNRAPLPFSTVSPNLGVLETRREAMVGQVLRSC